MTQISKRLEKRLFINHWKTMEILVRLKCYDLKLKELSNRTTLVLSNTRELDRVPNTK